MCIRIFPLVIVFRMEKHNVVFFVGRFCLSTYIKFLGVFKKLQEVTISFVISVYSSIDMEQPGSH